MNLVDSIVIGKAERCRPPIELRTKALRLAGGLQDSVRESRKVVPRQFMVLPALHQGRKHASLKLWVIIRMLQQQLSKMNPVFANLICVRESGIANEAP